MLEVVGYEDIRKCCKCGGCKVSNYWHRYKDGEGVWDGISYLCDKCSLEHLAIKNGNVRKCCKCGKDRVNRNWHRFKDKEGIWDGISYLCDKCSLDRWAQSKGYEDFADYSRERNWNKGISSPMSENEDCAVYLGIHIAERVLSKVFEDVKRMSINNHGFDFICKKGYKIDVKSATVNRPTSNGAWSFGINHNDIADYFLLIGFDDRENLEPMHIWLFKKDEMIRGKPFHMRKGFSMEDNPINLEVYNPWELTDKLEKMKECCDKLKSDI